MPQSVPVITIFGGSGFVGRYITQNMARAGWRVRVAVRRPDEAGFVRTYGFVGQVEPIQANIRDDASTRAAIEGADAVINCVGILAESGKQTFDAVVGEGAARVARFAAEAGVRKFVQISAIGADAQSDSAYARNKAEAEAAVTQAFPDAVILRPSIIFGTEDEFFNRFAAMARLSPVLPIVAPETKFQPVYVCDVADAAAKAVTKDVAPGIYELGGPEIARFRDLMDNMLAVIGRKRVILAIPTPIARLMGRAFDMVSSLSGGIIPNGMITADQVDLLQKDNVVAQDARGFDALGMEATAMDAVIGKYLYSYRPHGQYEEIVNSARTLRD